MKRKLLLAAVLLFFAGFAHAQNIPATANLTASDTGACTTIGACLTANVATGSASSVVQITGTFSATLQFEGTTSKGGTFVAVNAYPVGGSTAVTSATSTGAWRLPVAGLNQVRVRCSTYASGTAVVALTLSTGSPSVAGSGGGGGGGISPPAGDIGGTTGSPTVVGTNGQTLPISAALLATNSSSQVVAATTPVGVANGGTGLATLTAHAVQVGEGTSTPAQVVGGVSGQYLTANNGADPTFAALGIIPRTVSGTTGAILCDTGTATQDRGNLVVFTSGSAVAVTVPQAGSTGCGSNFAFKVLVEGAGTVTFTPTTSTVTYCTGSACTSAATSVALTTGQSAVWTSDNTNYTATIATSGAGGVTSVATTSPITGGPITGTGTIACGTCVTSAASLTSTALMTGGGSQASQTPSATSTLSSGGNLALAGTATATSVTTNGSGAGAFVCTAGTAQGHATASTITAECPASVTAYELVWPGASATGIVSRTNASNVDTESIDTAATLSTGTLTLGTAGSVVGGVALANATSGTITLAPTTGALGSVTATLPANTGTIAETNLAQTFTLTQTFAGITPSSASFSGTAPAINLTGTTPYLNLNALQKQTLNTCTSTLTTSTFTLALSPVSLCTYTLPATALTWAWRCEGFYSVTAGTTPTFAPGVTWVHAPSTAGQWANIYTTDTGTVGLVQGQTATTTNTTIVATGSLTAAATTYNVSWGGIFAGSATSGTFSPTVSLTGTGATGTFVGACTIQ